MADLVVHNTDDRVFQALRERAERSGRSVESEHRLILTHALLMPEEKTFLEAIANMQDVGCWMLAEIQILSGCSE